MRNIEQIDGNVEDETLSNCRDLKIYFQNTLFGDLNILPRMKISPFIHMENYEFTDKIEEGVASGIRFQSKL